MRLPLATAALLLVTAAPAAAAPTPGATYGGGQLPVSLAKGGDNALVSAAVAADGVSVRVVGSLSVRCNRRPGATQQFAANGRLGADGRLRLQSPSRTYFYATKGSTPRGRVALDLGFEGPAATGSLKFAASFTDRGRRVRCDETVPLNLRAPGADPGTAGPPKAGATLFGTGSARYRGAAVPLGLKVSGDGKRVNPTFVGAPLACGEGVVDYLINSSPSRRIAADGTFKSRERFTLRFKGGDRLTTTFRLDGRFTAQGVTGTYSARTRNCRTGTISFTATP